MKRTFLSALAGLGVAGALAAALALAAPAPASAAQPAAPAQQDGLTHDRRGNPRAALTVTALVRTAAEQTGLSAQEVLEALRGGQSLAEVAAANGSSGDAVVAAVAAKAEERLDRLVAAGRLSQERADTLLARLTARATELVNDEELGRKIDERADALRTHAVTPALVRAASAATGLPVGDIAGRMRDGESLEQIVRAAGADPAAVLDAATASFRAAAEQAMTATR